MSRVFRLAIAMGVFVVTALSCSTALAAPSGWQRIDVQLHPEQGSGVLIVAGELAKTARLPAAAELSVPKGSELLWLGQIKGGDASADPELKATKTTVGDSDVYRFTMTESRLAQAEVKVAPVLAQNGAFSPAVSWKAPAAVPEARIAVRIPDKAQITQSAPGARMTPAESGTAYYSKSFTKVKAGDELSLSFAYTVPAAGAAAGTAAATTAAGSNDTLAVVAFVALAAAGLALAYFAVRSRKKAQADGRAVGSTKAKERASASSTTRAASRADSAAPAPERPAGSAKRVPVLVIAGVVGVLILGGAAVASSQANKPLQTGGVYTKTFSAGEPCATMKVAVAAPDGEDPAKTAERLFEALRAVPSMNTASYDAAKGALDVGYCESGADPAKVRSALQPTGLMAAEQPAAPQASGGATATAP